MKKKANMKSSQKMTDCCKKSNVSNKANSKASKNIGFDSEASSFELDKNDEDSFKLR